MQAVAKRIHVLGASGCGTTTLGRALAERLGVAFHDIDDYFWLPSEPPYRQKRQRAERLRLLTAALSATDSWVLSGSLVGWGEEIAESFELVFFLLVPTEVRLARLRSREAQRQPVPPNQFQAFLEWAAKYDDGGMEMRSRRRHEVFVGNLKCRVVRLEGDRPAEALCAAALSSCGG